MPVIAVTGGIGSGKSTVRRMLEELGAFGIDADGLARQTVEPGSEGARLLREAFGPGFFDEEGRLDRKKMAGKVFADPEARLRIEEILHPLIRAAEKEVIRSLELSHPGAVIVVEVPLLAESGRAGDYAGVVLVTAPREARIERLVGSGRYSAEEAGSRIATQAGDRDREKVATWVVDNGRDLEHTFKQVEEVYRAAAGL